MIYDRKSNLEQYRGISKNLDFAIEYIMKTDFSRSEEGRYTILGDRVFAMVQTPDTKSRSVAKWEAHKKYMDIQFLIEGDESIGFQTLETLTIFQDYDTEKDIVFFDDNGLGFFVPLKGNDFVICFPQDAHMPLIQGSKSERIKKVVVKVLI